MANKPRRQSSRLFRDGLHSGQNDTMGDTATLPNFSFEVQGRLTLSGTNGLDANPAAIISDFLTNPRYGAGFPAANLGDLSVYYAYCEALGIVLSPMLDTQQEALHHLSDIVKITNSAIVWSGGLLKIVPYGDQAVTGNGVTTLPTSYRCTASVRMISSSRSRALERGPGWPRAGRVCGRPRVR